MCGVDVCVCSVCTVNETILRGPLVCDQNLTEQVMGNSTKVSGRVYVCLLVRT